MSGQTFVVVGASLAGAKATEELRVQGFDGRVVLIGSEPERPYERPPLTKDYLRGESQRENAYVHEEGFYAQREIELVTDTSASSLDLAASRLRTSDGGEFGYDRLLLATGAEPRRLSIPGAHLGGVCYLRTLGDCDELRERLSSGGRVVVIGAGWIGSEFAASARQRGLEVTVIDPHTLPNEQIFGPEIGAFYRDVHSRHGVELLLGESVQALLGERVIRAVRTSSRVIDCDFVVVGIGVAPRVELAREAGLEVENGIVVDEKLQTSSPKVFAAGDVASPWHPFYEQRIRVEHWANALNQGPAAARAMLGESVRYERIPYFFSDQYDVGMEYSGFASQWDEVVFRGDSTAGEFVAFWLSDGFVVAGMNVNVWDVNEDIQALIQSRQRVDLAVLRDLNTPLHSLLPQATTES